MLEVEFKVTRWQNEWVEEVQSKIEVESTNKIFRFRRTRDNIVLEQLGVTIRTRPQSLSKLLDLHT
jgi:hypothetical protein